MRNSSHGKGSTLLRPLFIAPALLIFAVLCPVQVQSQQFNSTPAQSGPTARELYQQGESAATSENYYHAIERFLAALKQNPSYLQPMIGLANAYYAIDEYDVALTYVKEAQKYSGDNTSVQNLEARILLGLGSIDSAKAIYQKVLARQPYNIEARIGLAELSVAQGNTAGALSEYLHTLNLEPQNRKALLSLALVYRARGQNDIAGNYIKLALRYHSDSAIVHLLAGEYYLSQQKTGEALTEAQTALALKPDYPAALILLGTAYLDSADYTKTIATMDQLIASYHNRPDSPAQGAGTLLPLAWYLKAVAQARMGKSPEAIVSFQRLLAVDPSDELARIAMEQVVKQSLPLESTRRDGFAAYHFKIAQDLESQNLFQHALFQYRQGLQLAPYSRNGRLAFADLYRLAGYRAKYVNELEVLQSLGYTDKTITDHLEIYKSLLLNSVANDWQIKQFQVSRKDTSVLVYQDASEDILIHPDSGGYFATYFRDLMLGYELVVSPKPAQQIHQFADAFSAARSQGSDYFVILSIDEGKQSFKVTAKLYLSRTGTETGSFTVYRSGNDRVRRAMAQLADDVHSEIPVSGSLIARNFDRGVIDLGTLHGVKAGDVFTIVQANALSRNSNGTAFIYPSDTVVGTFTVTRLDDAISEGTLKQDGISDNMTVGDQVVLQTKKKPNQSPPNVFFPPLYQRLRGLQ